MKTRQLQQATSIQESPFLEEGLLADKIEYLRKDKHLDGLTTLIIDSVEEGSVFDVFNHLKKLVINSGAVTIASTLAAAGVNASAIYEAITPKVDYHNKPLPDIVGISSIIGNMDRARRNISLFNKRGAFVVAGGPAFEFTPHLALDAGADVVVQGDGEYTLLSLIERLINHRKDGESLKEVFQRTTIDDILGLYYYENGELRYTGQSKLIRNLDESPMPDYSLVERPNKKKRVSKVRSIYGSMGCPNKCSFCSVRERNYGKYREKSPRRLVDEIKQAISEGYRDGFITDDHFLASPDHAREFCEIMENEKIRFRWSTQTTVRSVIEHPDILQHMKKAGCYMIELGVESTFEKYLKYFRKNQTVGDIVEAIRILKKEGLNSHAMIVLPPHMPREDIGEMAKFLIHIGVDSAQFCSEGPIPGTDSYDRMSKEGIIIKSINGKKFGYKYCDGHHVIASKNPYESQMNLLHAYDVFYAWPNVWDSLGKMKFRTFGHRILARAIMKGWKSANREYLRDLKTGNIEYLPKS